MGWLWITVSFNYYLIGLFLKYLPGDIYQNSLAAGCAEFCAMVTCGVILQHLSMKRTLSCLFILSASSGLCLIESNGGAYTAGLVMTCKFGIAAAFNCLYIYTTLMFKPTVSATAFGMLNFFARLATVMAPFVAEMPEPVPISILSVMCFTASIAVLGIVTPPKEEQNPQQASECELNVET